MANDWKQNNLHNFATWNVHDISHKDDQLEDL